jgi:flagellar protein FliL
MPHLLRPPHSLNTYGSTFMTDAVVEKDAGNIPGTAPDKRRKLLIVGGIVAAVALCAVGAYYFLKPKSATEDVKPVAGQAAPKATQKLWLYLPMDTFTVNLRDAEQERFLQATINLEIADSATVEAIKLQMPSIRNRVLLLLSSKTSEDLMPREGKEKLSAEIATELRKSLEGATASKGVEQVLFSHFVIQ